MARRLGSAGPRPSAVRLNTGDARVAPGMQSMPSSSRAPRPRRGFSAVSSRRRVLRRSATRWRTRPRLASMTATDVLAAVLDAYSPSTHVKPTTSPGSAPTSRRRVVSRRSHARHRIGVRRASTDACGAAALAYAHAPVDAGRRALRSRRDRSVAGRVPARRMKKPASPTSCALRRARAADADRDRSGAGPGRRARARARRHPLPARDRTAG